MADEFEARLKQFEKWVAEPIAVALTAAVLGAVNGVFADLLSRASFSVLSIQRPTYSTIDPEKLARFGRYQPLARSFIAGSVWEQARNFAVVNGVGGGIGCVMMKARGKEDVQTCMVAAFGYGAALSLVTGLRGPEVISCGVMLALMVGGLIKFKVHEKLSNVKNKGVCHDKTREMFSLVGLGIDNFKTGFFTGNALSLLADHQRKEAKKGGKMTWFFEKQAIEKLFNVKAKDVSHDRTRGMFSSIRLGIDDHAMNFNTCFFTRNALSLFNDHRQE